MTTTNPVAPPPEAPATGHDKPPRSPVATFARHYAEMVVAMFLGMIVLGSALTALLSLVGVSLTDAPALQLLGMALTMTIPMVSWMRYRGRAWARAWEMAGAMFVPSFVLVGLLWAGVQTDVDALMGIQHLVMFPSMLAVMLLRWQTYASVDRASPADEPASATPQP